MFRGIVNSVTDTEGRFFGDVPSEIREVLDRYIRADVLRAALRPLRRPAGKSDALLVMDKADETHVAADQPEDPRDVFAGVRTALPKC